VLGRNDVGHRVVVRWFVEKRGNRPIYSDALGELIGASETHLTVRTADGPVEIATHAVVATKRIPDRRARSATERLELVAAQGWPAPETAHLGDWLLRAAGGWTSRGNSALAVGDPGRPAAEAVDAVADWYRSRGLTPAITVPVPLGRRVVPELRRRGWLPNPVTLVQTAPLDPLARAEPGIRLETAPSEAWLAAVGAWKGPLPAAARHILSAPPQARFACGYAGSGALVATARGVVTEGWLGISVVRVVPEQRRRGWAARLSRTLAAWAVESGATRAYLQVEAHNEAAVALYAGLGFTTAHSYVTYRAPG
jgi:ribosomal protein S18 acetylase RimI-like enzyme